jgi:hypothetical protein
VKEGLKVQSRNKKTNGDGRFEERGECTGFFYKRMWFTVYLTRKNTTTLQTHARPYESTK